MKQLSMYFKSDFTVILASEAQWGGSPFRLKLWTASPAEGRSIKACFDGEVWHNCRLLEDGRLLISVNQGDLGEKQYMGIGTLKCEIEFYLSNSDFNDHFCNEFVKPFEPVFVDEDGNEYNLFLDNQGASTINTIGTLPAFYQKGDKGDKGEKGDKGDKGDQGIQGIQGEKGDKGDKGDTGATGATGPQGIQGEKGDTGATGATGPQGLKGDKGDKGDPGDVSLAQLNAVKEELSQEIATKATNVELFDIDTFAIKRQIPMSDTYSILGIPTPHYSMATNPSEPNIIYYVICQDMHAEGSVNNYMLFKLDPSTNLLDLVDVYDRESELPEWAANAVHPWIKGENILAEGLAHVSEQVENLDGNVGDLQSKIIELDGKIGESAVSEFTIETSSYHVIPFDFVSGVQYKVRWANGYKPYSNPYLSKDGSTSRGDNAVTITPIETGEDYFIFVAGADAKGLNGWIQYPHDYSVTISSGVYTEIEELKNEQGVQGASINAIESVIKEVTDEDVLVEVVGKGTTRVDVPYAVEGGKRYRFIIPPFTPTTSTYQKFGIVAYDADTALLAIADVPSSGVVESEYSAVMPDNADHIVISARTPDTFFVDVIKEGKLSSLEREISAIDEKVDGLGDQLEKPQHYVDSTTTGSKQYVVPCVIVGGKHYTIIRNNKNNHISSLYLSSNGTTSADSRIQTLSTTWVDDKLSFVAEGDGKGLNGWFVFGNPNNPLDWTIVADESIYKDVAELDKRVTAIEGASDNGKITNLFKSEKYLPKVATLKAPIPTTGSTILSLMWCSDIHGNNIGIERMTEWRSVYTRYVDGILNLGDTIQDNLSTYDANLTEYFAKGGQNVMLALGNHDVTSPNSSTKKWDGTQSITDMYQKYVAKMNIAGLGLVQPTGAATNGDCYYYKDYPTFGVRLIVLDSVITDTTYQQRQSQWLADTLASAKNAGLAVVCATHYPPMKIKEFNMVNGYDSNSAFASHIGVADFGSSEVFPTTWVSEVSSFIANGGDFMCWLCGHVHLDHLGVIVGNEEQIAICITTGNPSIYNRNAGARMCGFENTIGFDAFNHISFNKSQKLIKMLRIGADTDGYGRPIDAVTIDYDSKSVIV